MWKCAFDRSYARRSDLFKVAQETPGLALAFGRGVEFTVEKIDGAIQEIGVIGPGECAVYECVCDLGGIDDVRNVGSSLRRFLG